MALVQNAIFLFPLLTVSAYPAFYMARTVPQLQHSENVPQMSAVSSSLPRPKRAFDRLDASPFDFDSVSKRFNDDNELLSAIPLDDLFVSSVPSPFVFETLSKRSFDRLANSAVYGQKRKRTFDHWMQTL